MPSARVSRRSQRQRSFDKNSGSGHPGVNSHGCPFPHIVLDSSRLFTAEVDYTRPRSRPKAEPSFACILGVPLCPAP